MKLDEERDEAERSRQPHPDEPAALEAELRVDRPKAHLHVSANAADLSANAADLSAHAADLTTQVTANAADLIPQVAANVADLTPEVANVGPDFPKAFSHLQTHVPYFLAQSESEIVDPIVSPPRTPGFHALGAYSSKHDASVPRLRQSGAPYSANQRERSCSIGISPSSFALSSSSSALSRSFSPLGTNGQKVPVLYP